ncbi:Protein of unknown function [Gryllus bimaculatus]|nr:Protein of unknown function [Gryllus bimaculatus]
MERSLSDSQECGDWKTFVVIGGVLSKGENPSHLKDECLRGRRKALRVDVQNAAICTFHRFGRRQISHRLFCAVMALAYNMPSLQPPPTIFFASAMDYVDHLKHRVWEGCVNDVEVLE